jgi:hypothetical protein
MSRFWSNSKRPKNWQKLLEELTNINDESYSSKKTVKEKFKKASFNEKQNHLLSAKSTQKGQKRWKKG